MKNIILALIPCTLLFTTAAAQKQTTTLSGKLSGSDITTPLHLKNMTGADLLIPVNGDGTFDTKVTLPAKGFYSLTGVGQVYLEPGYQLQIALGPDSTYRFSGKGSFENNATADARKALSQYVATDPEQMLGQEALYTPVPVFIGKMDAFVKDGQHSFDQSPSAFFREMAGKDLAYYGKYVLAHYSLYYGTDLEKQAAFYKLMETGDRKDTAFQRRMQEAGRAMRVKRLDSTERAQLDKLTVSDWDKNDAALFQQSAWYRQVLDQYLSTIQYSKYRHLFEASIEDNNIRTMMGLYISKGEIKDSFMLQYYTYTGTRNALKMLKDKPVRDSLYKSYIAGTKHPAYLKEIREIYSNANTYSDNTPAPDFSYEDVSGKKVSLKDLRGKYVYIDVWATWCGPCKMEIPHLSKIEALYEHKKIRFVSLSVDKTADKQKWKDFVQKGNLKGIQLLADKDFQSDFVQKFNINAIPRFILIGPDGKIVSADALRPSNPELKALLDKLLTEG
ncbi:TlpA family protein disulfide reductase [Chitinophaga ginsengisegetis]|uniref:TlpA family protein disulfide reductase n=1 Tax=Chitinophaga ginsengisegetis TaxID=393003 RepID=UPI00342D7FAA